VTDPRAALRLEINRVDCNEECKRANRSCGDEESPIHGPVLSFWGTNERRRASHERKSQIPSPKSKKTKVSKATSESRFWDLELGIWDLGFTDDLLTIY
jgi:hypothetical protein